MVFNTYPIGKTS